MRRAGTVQELDALICRLGEVARLLPRLTAQNAAAERGRLVGCLERGELPVPRWRAQRRPVDPQAWRWLEAARQLAHRVEPAALYQRRLDELELDLTMIDALGDARRVRPLAARRFGTGATEVPTSGGPLPLARIAEAILEAVPDSPEPRSLPAMSEDGELSLGSCIQTLAAVAGVEVTVRVEPRLAAAAAAGERTVLVADRLFGRREALRLAVHEVLGHLVSAANGRAQPLRLLEIGTASSFADQEGLAIHLEEQAGVLDGRRLRTLAARVVAADRMHAERSFGETARELVDCYGFGAYDAVTLSERAFRGGGVARDVGYLGGWLRVRDALRRGRATIDELRLGRVGLRDLPSLRELGPDLVRPPVYRPSLSRSLRATCSGTSFDAFPPSAVTSFTRFEAT